MHSIEQFIPSTTRPQIMTQILPRPGAHYLNAITTTAQLLAAVKTYCLTEGMDDDDATSVGRVGILIADAVRPDSDEDVRAAVQLVERFSKPGQDLVFCGHGPDPIDCDRNPARYVWEALKAGIEVMTSLEEEAIEIARYREMFERCFPEHEGAEV